MRKRVPQLLLFTTALALAACGKQEATVPDSAFANRSALTQPQPSSPPKGVSTATSTDTGTNPIPRPVSTNTETNVDVPPPNPALSDEELVAAALEKANAIRIENGSPELEHDPRLSQAAQRHAQDMKARNFFDHKSPDGSLPSDRVKATGASYTGVGENIAMKEPELKDIDELFKIWMDSPPHKQGLLEKQFTKHGMGYKDGRWVHVFAR